MRLHFAHVPALDPTAAEAEFNAFLAGHPVVSSDRQLVLSGASAYWAVAISWLDARGPAEPKRGDHPDYRELLPEAEFAVCGRLRVARKAWAERDGVPPYAVFTNEQLAAIAKRRVDRLAQLADIEGVGKAKLEKYAKAVLALLTDAGRAPAPCVRAARPGLRPRPPTDREDD